MRRHFWTKLSLFVISLMLSPLACGGDQVWLNSQERAAYRDSTHWFKTHYYRQLKKAQNALSSYSSNRSTSREAEAYRQLCSLSKTVIRDETYYRPNSEYPYIYPASFERFLRFRVNLMYLAHRNKHAKNCSDFTWKEHMNFYDTLRNIEGELKIHATRYSDNPKQQYEWSNTFSLELVGLPFKIEFIEGSAKLKLSKSLGPFKFDFQTGPKKRKNRVYSGLEYLTIFNPEGRFYHFDIRGVDFSIEAPISKVKVFRTYLQITCDTDCVNNLEKM